MSKQKNATGISLATRKRVKERDGYQCILCGMPHPQVAHYIARSQGGLGIEQNLVCLCTQCHQDYDNGSKREEYGRLIKGYLKGEYPRFPDEKRVYDKYSWLPKVKENDK